LSQWLRLRPENEEAVALPLQNSTLVNELIQIRVAREFGFRDNAGCRLIRAAPSLYADVKIRYDEEEALECKANFTAGATDENGQLLLPACALMAALPPYRAFNRSRAGEELVVDSIAPDVRLTRLLFPTHGDEEDSSSSCLSLCGPLKAPAGLVSTPMRLHSLARDAGRAGKLCVVAAGSFT